MSTIIHSLNFPNDINMIRKLLLFSVLSVLLSSCLATKDKTELVILQHPDTMDFQECRLADWGSGKALRDNEECVNRYRQQGYIIWGSR